MKSLTQLFGFVCSTFRSDGHKNYQLSRCLLYTFEQNVGRKMAQCTYIFGNGSRCEELTHDSSNLCILHIEFPVDESSEEFTLISELKDEKVTNKIAHDNFNFEGARLRSVDFSERTIDGDALFRDAKINAYFNSSKVTFNGLAIFQNATFEGAVSFQAAAFKLGANFQEVTFGDVNFQNVFNFSHATFEGGLSTDFKNVTFNGRADFSYVTFEEGASGKSVDFTNANFNAVNIVTDFSNAQFIEGHEAKSGFDGIAIFHGATFRESTHFKNAIFEHEADFRDVTFGDDAALSPNFDFSGAKFNSLVHFSGAKLKLGAFLGAYSWISFGALFKSDAYFRAAMFEGAVIFEPATFEGFADFEEATFKLCVNFHKAKFVSVSFLGTAFEKGADFREATIGDCEFGGSELKAGLSLRPTTFTTYQGQENACRAAKQSWDSAGDRSQADYYFYHEMEAKRKLKTRAVRWIELPAQFIYGYGVHPERLMAAFVLALILFDAYYWRVGEVASFSEGLYFSFTAMVFPGSAYASPKPGLVGLILVIQSLFGLLLWGSFIATLSRKFGR